MTGQRYPGLIVVLPRTGRAWTWLGFIVVMNKAGEEVRVERWEGSCRYCSGPITATQKIPKGIAKRYLAHCVKAGADTVEVRMSLPGDRKFGNLERVNCSRHLWNSAPEAELV